VCLCHLCATHASLSFNTAASQFSDINVISVYFFFVSMRAKVIRVTSFACILLILLSGDVRLNHDPVSAHSINMCTLNM
jgi:hypothetical protein